MLTTTEALTADPKLEGNVSVYEVPESFDPIAQELQAIYPDVEVINLMEMIAPEQLNNFFNANAYKLEYLDKVKTLIADRTAGLDPDQAARERYRVEYMTGPDLSIELDQPISGNSSNYDYWSPILDPRIFNLITQVVPEGPEFKLLEAGAGSGNNLQMLAQINIPTTSMVAVDISENSRNLILSKPDLEGVTAYACRIEDLQITSDIDLLMLSYFVDRDSNQRSTFEASIKALKSGGKLVLEGLLPAVPVDPSGVSYSEGGENQITRGNSAIEDTKLLVKGFQNIAKELSREYELERIAMGVRFVYSRDGFEILPSYFITGKVY